MKEVSKKELHDILKAHPKGGVVFVPPDDQMVHISYKSDFGARCLEIDEDGEPYCYDWSINEYGDDEIFKLYEHGWFRIDICSDCLNKIISAKEGSDNNG